MEKESLIKLWERQENMIKVLSLFISFFSIVMALVTIIQGIRAAYDQWDKTVNKYEYLKNRNVNDLYLPHRLFQKNLRKSGSSAY